MCFNNDSDDDQVLQFFELSKLWRNDEEDRRTVASTRALKSPCWSSSSSSLSSSSSQSFLSVIPIPPSPQLLPTYPASPLILLKPFVWKYFLLSHQAPRVMFRLKWHPWYNNLRLGSHRIRMQAPNPEKVYKKRGKHGIFPNHGRIPCEDPKKIVTSQWY